MNSGISSKSSKRSKWFKTTKISIGNRCPYCGSKNFRRSQRLNWVEELLRLVQVSPYRCTNYKCSVRFLKLF